MWENNFNINNQSCARIFYNYSWVKSWLTIENCVLKFMVEVEKNSKNKPVIWQWWSDTKIIMTLFSQSMWIFASNVVLISKHILVLEALIQLTWNMLVPSFKLILSVVDYYLHEEAKRHCWSVSNCWQALWSQDFVVNGGFWGQVCCS